MSCPHPLAHRHIGAAEGCCVELHLQGWSSRGSAVRALTCLLNPPCPGAHGRPRHGRAYQVLSDPAPSPHGSASGDTQRTCNISAQDWFGLARSGSSDGRCGAAALLVPSSFPSCNRASLVTHHPRAPCRRASLRPFAAPPQGPDTGPGAALQPAEWSGSRLLGRALQRSPRACTCCASRQTPPTCDAAACLPPAAACCRPYGHDRRENVASVFGYSISRKRWRK